MSAINSVLLIEDNPGDAWLVTACLDERFGARCTVRRAHTLAEGLHELRRGESDVVLLDLGLPDSQGLGAYHEVNRAAPRTPVIILTGHDDEEQALQALSVGAEDYLSKRSADGVTLVRTLQHAVLRRRLAEQLRDSEARFRAIVETAQEGILLLDRDGWVRYHNQRAGAMLGVAHSDMLGRDDPVLRIQLCVRLEDEEPLEALLRTPAGERAACELQLMHGESVHRWVIAAAGGVRTAEHGDEVVLLLTDIGEQKHAEEQLGALTRELEHRVAERTALLQSANAELRTLGRAMAHDLRTPLNGIIGMTQLVQAEAQQVMSTTAWRRLELIDQSAREMNALITRLLALATLGQQELQREPLDLSTIAQQIAERLSASDDTRQVLWLIAPGLSASGDRALVTDLLQNLLGNAWKYTQKLDAAIIEVGCTRCDGAAPEFFVRDNGIGFDMHDATNLFEAFNRLPTAKGFAGTGLGLASAKRIVERHGGTIAAKGSLGAGARLEFTLEPLPACDD